MSNGHNLKHPTWTSSGVCRKALGLSVVTNESESVVRLAWGATFELDDLLQTTHRFTASAEVDQFNAPYLAHHIHYPLNCHAGAIMAKSGRGKAGRTCTGWPQINAWNEVGDGEHQCWWRANDACNQCQDPCFSSSPDVYKNNLWWWWNLSRSI